MPLVPLHSVPVGATVTFSCGVPHRILSQGPGSTYVEWIEQSPEGKPLRRRAHYARAALVTILATATATESQHPTPTPKRLHIRS